MKLFLLFAASVALASADPVSRSALTFGKEIDECISTETQADPTDTAQLFFSCAEFCTEDGKNCARDIPELKTCFAEEALNVDRAGEAFSEKVKSCIKFSIKQHETAGNVHLGKHYESCVEHCSGHQVQCTKRIKEIGGCFDEDAAPCAGYGCAMNSQEFISYCDSNGYGDGKCQDKNNNFACGYDGGDCCGNNNEGWKTECNDCTCKEPAYGLTPSS